MNGANEANGQTMNEWKERGKQANDNGNSQVKFFYYELETIVVDDADAGADDGDAVLWQ